MHRIEYISPEGLRLDGRRPEELRAIKCKLGIFNKADGSAYFEQGNTKVLATVYGPKEVTIIWIYFHFIRSKDNRKLCTTGVS